MADFTTDIVTKKQMNALSDAVSGINGFLVLGGACTQQSPLALAVDVAAIGTGTTVHNGTTSTAATAATTASFSAADATNARIDLVVRTASAVAVREGTAAADPVPGTLVAGDVELAQVKVNAGVTTITTSDITDRRQLISANLNIGAFWAQE